MLTADIATLAFDDIGLARLDELTPAEMDGLPFGVIGMSLDGVVEIYNATESRLAGLSAARVLGTHFFAVTAQCMNNYMVAQRFADEEEIDDTIDYVLTLRMRPTPVRLRMLKGRAAHRQYILIRR